LSDGGLWVHSPAQPTDDVCAELDALGAVRWIVVPNRFHHLHTPATAARYPDARVVAPTSVARDHWTWQLVARVSGRYEKVRTPPDVRMRARPGKQLSESLERMQALPIEQILVAHADPITDRPAQQLAEAWRFATSSK
jgi:hypothetical protein